MVKILDLAFQDLDKPGREYLESIRKGAHSVEARPGDDIVEVARKIANQKADHVIVLGDQDQDILGVLTEPFVNDQLSLSKQLPASTFSDALLKLAQAARVNRLDLPSRVRPMLYYCVKGKHYTTKPHCPLHP
jgi:hypothetical protein